MMSRKMVGFIAFAATSMIFLGMILLRQENIIHAIIAVVLAVLTGVALKGHYAELKG